MALTKVSGDFIQSGSITQGHLHSTHGITTSDIGEGSNLYFTTARVDSRIGDLSTSDLSEGTNLYYTDARADARIALQVGSNLDLSSKSTSDLSEGTNLYYTDARVDARITAADTDSLSEGSTNLYYTDARADARVALIVDSAPSTLDTLNELAAALGDDANFSTTVTNSIATKLPLTGGTLTGDLTVDDDFTAATARINLINYDGGTDLASQGELRIKSGGKTGWAVGDELGKISFYQTDGSGNGPGYQASIRATNETGNGSTTTISSCGLHFYTSNYNALERYAGKIDHDRIWDSKGGFAVDGTRKDLNWDTAYGWGNHADAGYLTSLPSHNHDDRYYTETETNSLLAGKTELDHVRSLGTTAFTGTATTAGFISEIESDGAFDSYTSFFKHSWSYAGNDNLADAGRFTETAGASFITWTDNSSDSTRGNITVLAIAPNTGGSAGGVFVYNDQGSGYAPGWREIWTSTSDGSGSGLDADKLDGLHASSFLQSETDTLATVTGRGATTTTSCTFDTVTINTPVVGSSNKIKFANNDYIRYDDANGVGRFHFDSDGGTNNASVQAATFVGALSGNATSATNADQVDNLHASSFLRSDADDSFTGKLVVANTGVRRAGMYGIYDSTKTGHIWSMGSAYMIPQNGANFGNLYGLAYYHPNNATNGSMASGHQMVWCANGTPQSAIGTNIWTDGIIDADGATFGGTVSMNGQAISMGNGSITGINHLVINDPGVNEGLQWTGGNNWYIQECSDAMTNASGNLQFSTGTTRRFTINTSGYVYAERYYDISSTGYYLDPGDTSNLNAATFAGDLQVNGNQVRTLGANADVKFSVWSGTTYGIGMTSGVTLGHLNDYAMTFCMNNDTDRGFWWGYSGQSKAAGAMALTTNGMLTVTNRVVAPNYYVDGYIYHNGDTNTYIRMVAADDMQLVAGGRQMIRMDEGGDPDKLRFVTDSDWTNSSGNWAMSGYITVQGAVYSNDGIIYDKDDSSAYYRATGTSKPHGDIYFDTTRRIWWNSQTTSDSYFAIQGGTSSGAYIDFNATGSTKKIHWRQFSTHTRFTMDMASAAFVAMGPVSANGSDLRLKENIITIDSALAKVKAMRGVYYNRKDLDTGRRRIGVIAQEIETVIPEVVDKVGKLAQHPEYDDDEIRAVSYGNISAVLIEAIKEQQTIIDDLKSRLETLENQ